jgi:chitinase
MMKKINLAATISFSLTSFSYASDNLKANKNLQISPQKTNISVTLPAKPSFIPANSKANVEFFKDGIKVAEVTDAKWASTTKLDVPIKETSDLTVSVPTIKGAIGTANPSAFTLTKDNSQNISIEYSTPDHTKEGTINIIARGDVIDNPTTSYTLIKPDGSIFYQGYLEINKQISLKNVPSSKNGVKYILKISGFINNGYKYTPSKSYPITVYNNKPSTININFNKKAILTEIVTFIVDGLPKNKFITLTLANKNGDTKKLRVNSNKSIFSAEIPQDGKLWNITAASIAELKITVSPSSFIANQSGQNSYIEVKKIPTPDTNWPDRVIVGYVRGYDAPWYSQPDTTNDMIQQAMDHGYNVIVYAFAGQKPNGEVYLPKWTEQMKDKVPSQINIIHNNNGIALLSIGGAVNYFDPDMSGDKAIPTGKAMGKYLADNGYDGLDIDVEHPNASSSIEENFIRYINAARAEFKSITGKNMYLTAAPQISGEYNGGQFANGNAKFAEPMYTQKFMDDADFDAVFIQTYNQYGGAKFDDLEDIDFGFLTMTFNLLSPETRNQMNGVPANSFYVPEDTKIVLGVPDFKDPAISESQYQTGSCLATAKCSGVGLYSPRDITTDIISGNLLQHNQYGGLMTWILNSDSYQGWTWVDGVRGVAYS